MAKASAYTKKCRTAVIILTITTILLMLGPAAFYLATGLTTAESAGESLIITATAATAIIFTIFCIWRKAASKSLPWIVIFALWMVLDSILPVIIVFGITQIVDELVVAPMLKYYKAALIANKQIDKRGI